MSVEQTLQDGEEAFVQHLKERARLRHVPIDAARWEHPARADSAELTVVSNRKWYIVSLHTPDLTDPQRGAEVIEGLLTTIKQNLPFARAAIAARSLARGVVGRSL
jgi:hypothetical protein